MLEFIMEKIRLNFNLQQYTDWPFTKEQSNEYFINSKDVPSLTYENGSLVYNYIDGQKKARSISFCFESYYSQFKSNKGSRGPLYSALKKERHSYIIDSTMGSGKDSCLITSWGFDIHCFERHPLLFVLLWDASKRARNGQYCEMASRMHLNFGSPFDKSYLNSLDGRVVLYYDPMYPKSESDKKSALPRQEIQFFRSLVGSDYDIENNLNLARDCADKTILKRALHSKWNFEKELIPDVSYKGKNTRYDVFFK